MTKAMQIIKGIDGEPAYAVLPISEYERLIEAADEAHGVRAFDAYSAEKPETFPSAVADKLLAGENPVRVFRIHRGLTQHDLAKRSGVSQVAVSQIETLKRQGSLDVLRALAAALAVDLEDLV
jgi:DNA-binding XRE family transcriptional regulator